MKGKIYLICDPNQNLYKIGVTQCKTEKRLKQLQTGNGTELHIVYLYDTNYPYKIEKMLHKRFSVERQHGEWFALNCQQVLHFIETCNEMEDIIDALKDNPFFR